MGETSKRHHTVPNFYLKRFASAHRVPRIGAANVHDGKRVVMPTSNATVRNNFYALEGHPDGADVFESALSELEGVAARIINRVTEGVWPLGREDREHLGVFLAFQLLRGPDTRATMDQSSESLLSAVITHLGVDGLRRKLLGQGKEVRDDLLEDLVQRAEQPNGLSVKTTSLGHIEQILELVPRVMPYLVGRPWALIRFDRKKLLTCDTPVALVADPDKGDKSGVGVMTAWGIAFPVTREIGLLLTDPHPLWEEEEEAGHREPAEVMERTASGSYDFEAPASAKMAQLFNTHTLANARSWVFHHPDDAGLIPDHVAPSRDREVEMEVITG